MKLARFWTRADAEATSPRGQKVRASARGWSNDSIDAARALALQIAQQVANAIASGPVTKKRYPYGDRPLPEPVIREFAATGSDSSAVVTRNVYGALVLNANHLMFVDVDKSDSQTNATSDGIMNTIASVVTKHGLSARVYETKAGYRVLITSTTFTAGSPEAESLLTEFGSDPLYIRLCKLQECFRARLTPKPWRCRMTDPPVNFPFETSNAQERFNRWQADYNAKTAPFATCSFLLAIGPGTVSLGFDELIKYHDEMTKAANALPLA
jgi:hypothetical protein